MPEGVSPLVSAAPGLALGIALVFAAAIPLGGGAAARAIDIIGLAMLLALGVLVRHHTERGAAGRDAVVQPPGTPSR